MRIENIIFRLFKASFAAYSEEKCRTPQWGFEALKWYIETDRASLDFLSACESLSDRRMITLIRKCSTGSTEEAIAIAKKYLKVA